MSPIAVVIWVVCLVVGAGLGLLLAQALGNNPLILVGAILGVGAAFFVNGVVKGQSGG